MWRRRHSGEKQKHLPCIAQACNGRGTQTSWRSRRHGLTPHCMKVTVQSRVRRGAQPARLVALSTGLAMKRSGWLFLAATLAAGILPATAADFPGGPQIYAPRQAMVIFRWTGFYFGAHAGGGFGRKDETSAPILNATSGPIGSPNPFTGAVVTGGTSNIQPGPAGIDVGGWLAGGQIGANY